MNRFFVVTIALLMLVCSIAKAEKYDASITGTVESFDLRSGIRFLMSKDDVKQKEQLITNQTNYLNHSNGLYIDGPIAGFYTASGEYDFNSDDKLESVTYYFNPSTDFYTDDNADLDFKIIEDKLKEKYGDQMSGISIVTSQYFIDYIETLNEYPEYQITRLSERLVKVKTGGYVKIEHYTSYYALKSGGETYYNHNIHYTYFSDNDVNTIMNVFRDVQGQRDNDL